MEKPVIVAATNGFYLFGEEVAGEDGWVSLDKAHMFGGFSGNMGMPGVASGRKGSTVNLDAFPGLVKVNLQHTIFVADSINLLNFSGTTLR